MNILKTHMKLIEESRQEVNLSTKNHPKKGKCKLPLKIYERKSLQRIAELK